MTPNTTASSTWTISSAKRLIGAALVALTAAAAPALGPLGPQSALASDGIITYVTPGNWHVAVHPVAITTPAGATVRLPLHLYVRGAEHLDAARTAQVTQTVRPGARGGTDVEVTVRVTTAPGTKAFATDGAIRGLDVPDGEGLFVQRGGNSDRPLVFSFRLNRA